ncbi:putative major facilitator superfamily transporter [Gordonia hirsuta DSM 44140 = NBRC 16056]|uniref:Putative major facilitator superfamily transporter n=1 Tax=Gordonia hirsuta DSM 44140 = NBRC 16056 TaxID=1121927 RepID=L7LC70_9ACTN|nr:MFS transporter [Gordonia hirsuta]GAC57633.1 putative major facilitator superfamily transporter [Gordonia hirsuta DSM 44140 = NBRC 16056]
MTIAAPPRSVSLGYAVGSVGTGAFGVLPGLVLAYYLTDSLGVGALLAAVIVVIPKAIDVVINPLIGARSDADVGATGGRTRLMWLGTLAILPLFVLTFSAPTSVGPGLGALWVLIFFSLAAVAYACFQVPYIALPAELTPDYHARTRLISERIVVLALTILVVGAGAPAIRDALGGPPGYVAMAVAVAALMGTGMAAATFWAGRAAARRPDRTPAGGGHSARDGLRALRNNRHYRILLAVFVIQALATAVMLAGAQYLATYVLDDKTALTPLFAALVAPALLVMPVWVRIGRRLGKRRSLALASTVFLLASAVLGVAIVAPGTWVFAPVALCGIGYAGMQTFPLAMLPDVIDEQTRRAGRDQGGALSGLWTAAETFGMAVGPGLFLLVLAAAGFVSSTGDSPAAQPHSALVGITAGFALLPAALIALSLLILARYDKDTSA